MMEHCSKLVAWARVACFVVAALCPVGVLAQPATRGDGASKDPAPAPDPTREAVDRAKAHRSVWTSLPADQVRKHEDADRFPGVVPGPEVAPRTQGAEIVIDAGGERWRAPRGFWHSTGLYAPAGEVVRVELVLGEDEPIPPGLRVRVGAHRDHSNIKGASRPGGFRRTPVDLTHSVPLGRGEPAGGSGGEVGGDRVARIANPFGGTVYIETDATFHGRVVVRVDGAVHAPYFRLGSTTPSQWAEARRAPAPWGEMVSDHVSLTVPSDLLRGIEDPTELMELWEKGARLCADLGGTTGDGASAQRLVWDPAISAGSMHSGHPIMCQGGRDQIVNLERLRRGEVWGFFHEIGHNNQWGAWTPKGQGEVTCNWFPMYVREVGLGLPAFDRAWPRFDASAPLPRGAIGTNIQGNHFLGLIIWDQIRDEFGWEPFRRVMREIRDPQREPAPKGKDVEERWDELLVRFSLATGRNLSEHFVAWGAELSDPAPPEVRIALARLEPWVHPLAPGQPGAREHFAPRSER